MKWLMWFVGVWAILNLGRYALLVYLDRSFKEGYIHDARDWAIGSLIILLLLMMLEKI